MPDFYIGLMSGTSADGIDAVVVDLAPQHPVLRASHTFHWEDDLHKALLHGLAHPEQLSVDTLGRLDAALGEAFADAALAIAQKAGLTPQDIAAIGSHGQTLFHAPAAAPAFTLQAGDASRIAARTGITTVADFRRRDIAEGGQGAPLVPAFHQAVFSAPGRSRAILNIGGIANLTLLPGDSTPVTGFDTGPGNVLLDAWTHRHRAQAFDAGGAWARSGFVHGPLLEALLQTAYLQQPPPKSTGRELFCLAWLDRLLDQGFSDLPPVAVQATLTEFSAASIAASLTRFAAPVSELFTCGGGAHNNFLLERLQARLPNCRVATTEELGLAPDWVEASAFAWLAKQTLAGRPGNLPSVTGARRAVVLGAVHPGH